MMTPLEDLGMIGDGETVALVSRSGSIEWLCLPRFDSPACCCSLLGDHTHGHWTIAPDEPVMETVQRYQGDTMILETDMALANGKIRLIDFMPIRSNGPVLIRTVTGLEGRVAVHSEAMFRFDYGNMPPWVEEIDGSVVLTVGPDQVTLRGCHPAELRDGSVISQFEVEAGEQRSFVLCYGSESAGREICPREALAQTQGYWRGWIGSHEFSGKHAAALRRSMLTLKALIHLPTGGLVAAPTTSLPEQPGGEMNWDYRYCWLRDASFTLMAFLECGFLDEAEAWRDWILRAMAGEADKMQIVYRVDGSRRLDEAELPWLSGYRFARPVRIGNAAAGQLQLDVFGEVIRSLHAAQQAGIRRTPQERHVETAIVRHVEDIWTKPDHGFWEVRGQPRHYTYSKVMAWAALQWLLESESDDFDVAERHRMTSLRDHIHDVTCREGFNSGLGSFTSYFGGQEVDASLLLLPKVGFLPATDPRIAGTIRFVERKMLQDGLVRRFESDRLPREGAFLACSFWLAECQLEQGRRADAIASIERVLAIRNPLGLLSEEYDCVGRRLAGNFPQALSHLALVHGLLALKKFDVSSRPVGPQS